MIVPQIASAQVPRESFYGPPIWDGSRIPFPTRAPSSFLSERQMVQTPQTGNPQLPPPPPLAPLPTLKESNYDPPYAPLKQYQPLFTDVFTPIEPKFHEMKMWSLYEMSNRNKKPWE